MSKTISYIDGGKVSQIPAPASILTDVKEMFLSQVMFIYRSNQSRNISNSKTRSEVSGTTRKPWKQKGTGRARHGSMRSPIWIGGGITFGPTNMKNNSKRSTTKQRSMALNMILSLAVDNKKIVAVSDVPVFKKTKEASSWLASLPINGTRVAIVNNNLEVRAAFKNIPAVVFESPLSPNLNRIAGSDCIIISKEDLSLLASRNEIVEAAPSTTKEVKTEKAGTKAGK